MSGVSACLHSRSVVQVNLLYILLKHTFINSSVLWLVTGKPGCCYLSFISHVHWRHSNHSLCTSDVFCVITSAEEVCLSVSCQHYTKSTGRFTTKPGGRMWYGSGENPIHFAADPGIYFTFNVAIFNIFLDLSGNNSWIVMKKKSRTCLGDWYFWVCAIWCRSKNKLSRNPDLMNWNVVW